MNYVVYNPSSGEIVLYGTADVPDSQGLGTLLPNLAAGITAETHHIVSGAPVAYTSDQAAAKATRPSHPATWSNSSFSWVDTRTLDQIKSDTWDAVRDARDAELYGGFTWDGSKFDSDQVAQSRIQGVLSLAQLALSQGQAFQVTWTLFDNTTRTLSALDMINVGLALGAFGQAIFSAGVILRNQIDAATTPSQLYPIKWVNIF